MGVRSLPIRMTTWVVEKVLMAKSKTKSDKKPEKSSLRDASPEQMAALAWQAFGEEHFDEAEQLCERLVAIVPGHAHSWYLRGLVAAAQGRGEQALSYWEWVKNAPDLLPPLAQGRGRVLLSLGRIEEALVQFQGAMTYQPDDATNYFFMGLASLQQGALKDAQRYFRQASVLDPKLAPAHYELGVLALHAEQYSQALIAFKAAVELTPQSPEVANNLALAYQALGDATAAESWFRKAVDLKDDYAEAWLNFGLLLRAQGSKKADACINKALKLKPSLQGVLSGNE
ncbi:MAG: tetratricopeptide repeat protein [Sulfuricella sp.]|nr:tetratricopeptide repeat protein [Sulfuricella sp.]